MTKAENLYIIVIGCGRLGSFLANRLSNEGNSVVVIDVNSNAFNMLSADQFSGFKIEGDATELAVLKQAKIDKADVVIGATHDENVNIMTAQIARKKFNVAKVFVRILDPNKESFCKILGIESICLTSIAADKMIAALNENSNI
ncbi:MAG: potassium transporter TrkA [Planctomycetes bacterium GWF2_41_51]|nr:MAG: potassium transporter TrkA [Planctomycetes bacterium GWF2_41_51]HBG26499.1 potassium transporter TrkA [Phycisphaerales bacterium]